MPRSAKRSKEELDAMLSAGGLLLKEEYVPDKSYPLSGWVLTECQTCHTQAQYRLQYITHKTKIGEPVCRACYWSEWYEGYKALSPFSFYSLEWPTQEEVREQAEKNGFELVEILERDLPGVGIAVVKCKACGRQTVERPSDFNWGCTCQSHPKAPKKQAATKGASVKEMPLLLHQSGEACLSWWAHDLNDEELFKTARIHARKNARWRCPSCGNVFEAQIWEMTGPTGPSCPVCTSKRRLEFSEEVEAYKRTPCSEVPELMTDWDDERDPHETMVWPTGWRGMCPGDGQYRFRCKRGHHLQSFPYTYLKQGCPFCKAQETRGSGEYIQETCPELAEEWAPEVNGKWNPTNVREHSKRTIQWRCLNCGHQWEETPHERMKVRAACPSCGKILGSLAWSYPSIASEWSPSNPVNPWTIRPHAGLKFTPEWICSKDESHVWTVGVAARLNGSGCPECADTSKSRIELLYFRAAQKVFGDARSGLRVDSELFSHTWTIDILVRHAGQSIAIEYDGSYWHKDRADVDARKSAELVAAGYVVVRLREKGLPSIAETSSSYHEITVDPLAPEPVMTMRDVKEMLTSLYGGEEA